MIKFETLTDADKGREVICHLPEGDRRGVLSGWGKFLFVELYRYNAICGHYHLGPSAIPFAPEELDFADSIEEE